jgi:uncharacterized UBP type Zn finger protein
VYDVVSVVQHRGSGIDRGHYVAYRLEEDTGEWLLADDTAVTVVTEAAVLSAQAYLLVLVRRPESATE